MIRFSNVHKAFGPKKVLCGLNLEIKKGELFFILGRSGTGKSVALKHLVGLLRPDSGEIELDGEHLEKMTEHDFAAVRRKCGLVFQLPALLDSRTVFENLGLGIRRLPAQERFTRIRKSLSDVKLDHMKEDMIEKYPPQISYGEQKRVALARTLVMDPDYILYDEPTTGLDPITSATIHDLILSVSKNLGKTSIVVSHDMRNALRVADRIAVMESGQVIDLGTSDKIRKSKVPLTREFLEDLA